MNVQLSLGTLDFVLLFMVYKGMQVMDSSNNIMSL
jgi:hypothetical protein